MGISIWQLLIVLAIVLLLFGTKRLRNLGGDLGNAIKGFKKAVSDENKTETTDEQARVAQDDIVDVSATEVEEPTKHEKSNS